MRIPVLVFVLFALVFGVTQRANGWHIIGGELYYEYVSGDQYRITIKLYRDCYTVEGAPYDDPLWLGIYDGSTLVETVLINVPNSTPQLPVILDDPCDSAPPDVCVEEAIYTKIVTLENIPTSGLQLVYQRCCRNATILNIFTPADVGATYVSTVYPPSVTDGINSSPHFNNFPPIAICANQELEFDHSATDPDGDSLVYELCTPYQGATSSAPQPTPAGPPPYENVNFISPYNVNNMLGGTPAMYIDAQTGMLYANPNTVGQFVVGVCVKEYRNGVLIGETRRDFQFNVAPCQPTVDAIFNALVDGQTVSGDTLTICGDLTVDFKNTSIGDQYRFWTFGDPTTNADTSWLKNPVYTYPDTGYYLVSLAVNPGIPCADTAYKIISIRLGLNAGFTSEQACQNLPLQLMDTSIALDGELSNWEWDFGDGGTSNVQHPQHTYTSPGTYTVQQTVETSYGCKSTQSAPIIVLPSPLLITGPDTMICDLDSVRLFTTPGAVSYAWSPDYELSNTAAEQPMAAPDFTTTYTVQVINEFGCFAIDSAIIQVVDTVIATAWPDTSVCVGAYVHLESTGGVYYHWYPVDEMIFSHKSPSPYIQANSSSTYYVYSYIGSCFDVDSVTVDVLPTPEVQAVESQVINQGDTVQLAATGADTYSWTPAYSLSDSSISNPLAFPLNTTTYVVTGYGANGCYDEDSVIIVVTHDHYLYVPNAFSPNGDGINEFFQFFTKGVREILTVDIYNRWGEKVYSLEDSNGEPWDGTYKGDAQGINVFVYVIRAETFDGDVLQETGNVTLMR